MPKYHTLDELLKTFNHDAKIFYERMISIAQSCNIHIKVRLFAGQVAFYDEATLKHTFHASPVIVMNFLNDHVNIFASANHHLFKDHQDVKLTDKDTLQYPYRVEVDHHVFQELFTLSLSS